MPDAPDLRQQIKNGLQLLCGEKLLRGNPENVYQLAKGTFEIAALVGSPWKQLAAYRLAHVLFRGESFGDDPDREIERLKEIATHFKLAADYEPDRLFGPLPHIYLIAVLHRLKQADKANADEYQQQIETHYEKAATRSDRLDLLISDSNESETRQLQHHSFNLLELACYTLDLDYKILKGLGRMHDDNYPLQGAWRIVSNDPEMQAIEYDYEFGFAELNEIVARTPDSVGFVFSNVSAIRNGWKHHMAQEMSHEINDDFLKLLSVILDDPRLTERRYTNERNWHFPDHSPADMRQLKKRGKDAIVRLTGVQADRIFPYSSFELKIPVYGLINRAALRP